MVARLSWLRRLRDVTIASPANGQTLTYNSTTGKWENGAAGGGGAPTTADYLVGTAQGGLSAEIVVGATPGGELGGTWDSPTVDTVHSGSSHAQVQAAAEAASQPLDSDLSAIAALTTQAFGRSLLTQSDAPSTVALIGAQPLDADLSDIAGLSPSNDDVIQRKAGAWTNRTMAQLIADLAGLGTTFQPLDSDLTAIAALSTTSFGRSLLTLADAAALLAAAGAQASDATLTALAGANWAANAVPIGTGADSLSQTAFAANTFPARSSSGNLVAKTITDFALSLLDDTDAATARATLGVSGDPFTTITKVADETVNNSNVLQNDDELFFTGASGGVYRIDVFLIYVCENTTADFQWSIGEDNTLRGSFASPVIGTGDLPAVQAAWGESDAGNSVGSISGTRAVQATGWYVSAGGTVRIKWAQNTTNATNTTVKAKSYLKYWQVNA